MNEELPALPSPTSQVRTRKVPLLENYEQVPAHLILKSHYKLKPYILRTALRKSLQLSQKYKAQIYMKCQNQQYGGSTVLRGILADILELTPEEQAQGIITASDGFRGSCTAYACSMLNIKAVIVVPETCPKNLVEDIKERGQKLVEIIMKGDTLEEAIEFAFEYAYKNNIIPVIHETIHSLTGRGTVAIECLEDMPEKEIDFVLYPVSSGALGAGMGSYFKELSPETKIVGCYINKTTPEFQNQVNFRSLQKVENEEFNQNKSELMRIIDNTTDQKIHIDLGQACSSVIQFFQDEGILLDPDFGAAAASSLEQMKDQILGQSVIIVIIGNWTDKLRTTEITTLASIYNGHQFYMLVYFFRKPGSVAKFIEYCVSDEDDIKSIEYTKQNNREKGPAIVGITVPQKENFDEIQKRMKECAIIFREISPDDDIFKLKC